MKKYLLLLFIPILSFLTISCDKEDDVAPIDLNLFAGTWQVVSQDNQTVFEREDVLNITSKQIHEGFGGYQGYITTYFLRYDDTPIHDRVFTWSIREVENNQPLLDVVYQGELDSDDIWAGEYYYKIIKLRRRTDINIE